MADTGKTATKAQANEEVRPELGGAKSAGWGEPWQFLDFA